MKYSIIMPVYNVERFLSGSLGSIKKQTFVDFECIIVNDGSTDDSALVSEKIIDGDKRFNLVRQNNNGPSAARNNGLKLAAGEYVLFLDSDDVFSLDLLKTIDSVIEKQKSDIVVYDYGVLNKDGETWGAPVLFGGFDPPEGSFRLRDLKGEMLTKLGSNAWTKVFRRDFLVKNELAFDEDLRMGEDALFVKKALVMAKSISVIKATLVGYRELRKDSLSALSITKSPKDWAIYLRRLHQFLLKNKLLGIYEVSFVNACLGDILYNLGIFARSSQFREAFNEARAIVETYDLRAHPSRSYHFADAAVALEMLHNKDQAAMKKYLRRRAGVSRLLPIPIKNIIKKNHKSDK